MLLVLLLPLVLTAAALARYGPPGLRAWSGDTLRWAALLLVGRTIVGLLVAVRLSATPDDLGPELVRLAWQSLVVGAAFAAQGQSTRSLGRRLGLSRPVTHALSVIGAPVAVALGLRGHDLVHWALTGDVPGWVGHDAIARAVSDIGLWVWLNAGVAVGLVRMVHEQRADAREASMQRLDADRVAARLAALEARLRPHALLNALGGLAGLVRTDPAAAEAMTLALARLLRRTLATADTPTVPLADELALVDDYLAVERHRLGERLRVAVDVPEAVRGLALPRLALQPIVENAVVHGAGRTAGAVTVAIRADRVGDRLHVSVEDDGPPFADGWTGGTGLTSVGERLRLLWGERAALRVLDAPKRVVLDLPAVPAA